jgi:hypothetical protein
VRLTRIALAAALASGCSYTFASPAPRADGTCPSNGWLAIADIALAAGTGTTAAVAVYPCVGDVEQSGQARAIHCGTVAVGAIAATAYGLSAARGLEARRGCKAQRPGSPLGLAGDRREARPALAGRTLPAVPVAVALPRPLPLAPLSSPPASAPPPPSSSPPEGGGSPSSGLSFPARRLTAEKK